LSAAIARNHNHKLARALAALGANKFNAKFVRIDDLPLYNQDQESPLPGAVTRFKNELTTADGVLIVTPEHNRSIPAILKNAIDWGTRPYGKNVWIGKPGFITGTSPGAIGTALVQQHLRSVMSGLGMILLGGEAYVTFKPNLMDDQGNIGDEGTRKFLQDFVDRFATLVRRLSPAERVAAERAQAGMTAVRAARSLLHYPDAEWRNPMRQTNEPPRPTG
jgi:chromate reductase